MVFSIRILLNTYSWPELTGAQVPYLTTTINSVVTNTTITAQPQYVITAATFPTAELGTITIPVQFQAINTTTLAVTTPAGAPTVLDFATLSFIFTNAVAAPNVLQTYTFTDSIIVVFITTSFNFTFSVTFTPDSVVQEGGIITTELNNQYQDKEELNDLIEDAIIQIDTTRKLGNDLDLNDPFYEEDIPLRIDPYGEFEEVPLELEAPVYSVPQPSLNPLLMLLPIGKDRIRAPKPTTAEAEWITNTIINQMRKRDGYQPLQQHKVQEQSKQEQSMMGEPLYHRQPIGLFVGASSKKKKPNNQPPKEKPQKEEPIQVKAEPIEGVQNKVGDAQQVLLNELQNIEGLTQEDLKEIQDEYFVHKDVEQQYTDILSSLYPEEHKDETYLYGYNTKEEGDFDMWKAKMLGIYRYPLWEILRLSPNTETKQKINEIIGSNQLVFDTLGAVPHIGLSLIQQYKEGENEGILEGIQNKALSLLGLQEVTANELLMQNTVNDLYEFIQQPLDIQNQIKYAVKHFGLAQFTSVSNLEGLIKQIGIEKKLQQDIIQNKYKKTIPKINQIYDPFYDLSQETSIADSSNIVQDQYSSIEKAAISTIIMFGVQQLIQLLPVAANYYYAGGPAAALALIGIGNGGVDNANALVPYDPSVVNQVQQGIQQGLQLFQQIGQLMPLFNAPIEQLGRQFFQRVSAYIYSQVVNQGQQMVQVGPLAGNILNQVMNAHRTGRLDPRAILRIISEYNAQVQAVAPNLAIDAAQPIVQQVVQDPIQQIIEQLPARDNIGIEQVIEIPQIGEVQLPELQQLVQEPAANAVVEFFQRHGEQFLDQNINQAQRNALEQAFRELQNGLGNMNGIDTQATMATLLFSSVAATLWSSYQKYKKNSSSRSDPFGIFAALDKQMEKQEIKVYGQNAAFRKSKNKAQGRRQAAVILNTAAKLFQTPKLKQGKRLYPFRSGQPIYQPNKRSRLDDTEEILPPRVYNYLKNFPNLV